MRGKEPSSRAAKAVKAEIYPDYEYINETVGDMTESGWQQMFKETIDDINDKMPLYKRVKRYNIRDREFTKTSTRKIKRHIKENYSED